MDRVPSLETTEQLLAHNAWLTRVARALTTNADDAEEVVQQTWLRALERPPGDRRNLRSWIATLARNFVRSRRRAEATRLAHAARIPRPEPPGTPAESVARAELQQVVLEAVLSLAEPYRSTLVQRFLDELSAEEISKRSGAPVETVRTRIKRGLDQLRVRVAERLGGEREQLAALLAPLVGTGAVVMSVTAKLAIAAAVVAAVLAAGSIVTRGRASDEVAGKASGSKSAFAIAEPAPASAPAEASRVAIVSDREKPADSRPTVDDDDATFDIAGTVVDSQGARVAGATVVVADRAHSMFDLGFLARLAGSPDLLERDVSMGIAARTESDAKGNFRIERADLFRAWRIAAWSLRDGFAEPRDLAPSSNPLELRLLGGIGVRGVVLDVDGRPKGGKSVSAMTQFVRNGGSTTTSIPVDAEGRFLVLPLPVDLLSLSAYACPEARSDEVVVDRRDGPGIRDVTLQLESTPASHVLRGAVRTADGARLTRDSAWLAGFAPWELDRPVCWTLTVATAEGLVAPGDAVEICNSEAKLDLVDGSYELRLPVRHGSTATAVTLVLAARGHAVAVAPLVLATLAAADSDLDGPPLVVGTSVATPPIRAGALRVRVRDAATGALFTSEEMFVQACLTQANGDFRTSEEGPPDPATLESLLAPLPPGRCVVTVMCPGYVENWNEAQIEARPEPAETTVTLERARRRLRGIVRDADRRPQEKARVWWLPRAGDAVRRSAFELTTTRRDGRFLLEQVGASGGQIFVEAPGFAQAHVDVAAGEADARVDVELERGVDVAFRWASSVQPRPNRIRIVSADGSTAWDDGDRSALQFRLEWPRHVILHPGDYRYRVELAGLAAAEGALVARDGTTIDVVPQR